jgi:hypothetical protein
MTDDQDELCKALTVLAEEMRASRETVARLEQTVGRFVVAAERQLSSGEAVKRRAERVLRGMDPAEIAEMNRLLDKKLGGRR